MQVLQITDKQAIEDFLRPHTALHLYAIGDLDDFFWPYTTWYALEDIGQIQEIVLLYTGTELATLLALTPQPTMWMPHLLRAILPALPRHFHAHLSGNLATVLAEDSRVESFGQHLKMQLTNLDRLAATVTSHVSVLTVTDLPALHALYAASYPGNWFDPRMLETGCYYGIRHGEAIVSVAGIHVYSPQYRVAVLGNITTHPQSRGQGLAATVAAKVCQALLPSVDHIGLNVKADNAQAISAYRRIGFEQVAVYEECNLII